MGITFRAILIAIILVVAIVPGTVAAQGQIIHTVQPGENLFRIGLQYNLSWTAIMAANGLPNASVYTAQRLIIPGRSNVTTSSLVPAAPAQPEVAQSELAPAAAAQNPGSYIVQRGDNLFRIALRFGLTPSTLANANNISNPKLIYTGQVLTIPSGDVPPSIQQAATQAAAAAAPTEVPTQVPTPTEAPTQAPAATEAPTQAPAPTEVPTQAPTPAPTGFPAPEPVGENWIDVDLTQQRVYAMQGDTLVRAFIVSTGTSIHPTVTGQYRVYVKYTAASMSGPGYYLPGVPWIMYFYRGYGLHGTYWHNNFGTPMSHGCINLTIPEAEWLFNFSSVGTLVNIHY